MVDNLSIIEDTYSRLEWFERVTRRFNEQDRDICMEFYRKVVLNLVSIEEDLLEHQVKISKMIDKRNIIHKILPVNNGKFDLVIKDILERE